MENPNAYSTYTEKMKGRKKNLAKKTMKKIQTLIKTFFKN
jgi:hypothetical protein